MLPGGIHDDENVTPSSRLSSWKDLFDRVVQDPRGDQHHAQRFVHDRRAARERGAAAGASSLC